MVSAVVGDSPGLGFAECQDWLYDGKRLASEKAETGPNLTLFATRLDIGIGYKPTSHLALTC
jgi:hypothetical protein